jgi:hypothetical protein
MNPSLEPTREFAVSRQSGRWRLAADDVLAEVFDQIIQRGDACQFIVRQPYVKETFRKEQGIDHGERIAAQIFHQTGRTWQAYERLFGRFREVKL